MWGTITFPMRSSLAAVLPSHAKEAREIVARAESQVEDKDDEASHTVGPQTIRRLCDERVRAEGKGTALGTALGIT